MSCAEIWLKICQCVHRLKMNSIIQRSGLFMILYIQRRPRPQLLTSVIQPRRTHWMTTGIPATAIYMAHSFIILFNKRKYLSDKNVYFNQKYSRNGISLPLIILSYHELWPLNHIVILHNFKSWPSQENSHNMISPLFVLSTYTPTDIWRRYIFFSYKNIPPTLIIDKVLLGRKCWF